MTQMISAVWMSDEPGIEVTPDARKALVEEGWTEPMTEGTTP